MDDKFTHTREVQEKILKMLPVMDAHLNGESIEVMGTSGVWVGTLHPEWRLGLQYRIKPEPKLRPFNKEELAELVGKVVVRKFDDSHIVVAYGPEALSDGSYIVYLSSGDVCRATELLGWYLMSDKKPCGVEVQG